MTQLERLLLALRACGADQYRADPGRLNVWWAYCPACRSELIEARSLRIVEAGDSKVTITCWRGCTEELILGALRYAERYPNSWCRQLAAEARLAELELERVKSERKTIRTLQGGVGRWAA